MVMQYSFAESRNLQGHYKHINVLQTPKTLRRQEDHMTLKKRTTWAFHSKNRPQINASTSFDILVSDFNINALEQNTQILQILSNYKQGVTELTQISCRFSDHVFFQKQIMQDKGTQNVFIATHFSNYDAVFLTLQVKFSDCVHDFDCQL